MKVLSFRLLPEMEASVYYTAVIGDLVDSRKLDRETRAKVQIRLQNHFQSLERGSRHGVVSRPMITLGDEFQGLFSSCSNASGVIRFLTGIQELLRPTRVRFGIGIGSLSTSLSESAIGMDGPCFHRARVAIEAARKNDGFCDVRASHSVNADMLSLILSEMLRIRDEWSEEQREAIYSYLELPKEQRSWTRVAERLNRSPSAITQRQQAARWSIVRRMEEVSRRALEQLESEAWEEDR